MLKKIFKIIYQPYKFLIGVPLVFLSGIILNLFMVISCILFGEKSGHPFEILWTKFMSLLIPMRVKLIGRKNIKKKTSYVVVVNHKSNIDPIALYSKIPLDLRWVMKIELGKVPFFGYIWRKRGNILVDRKNRDSAIKSIANAKKKLKNGTSVIFFPEGTRFPGKGLGSFKKGAFHVAIDTGLPILPVTLSGCEKIFPRGGFDVTPGKVIMTIHEPIETKNLESSDIDELIEKTKKVIASAL